MARKKSYKILTGGRHMLLQFPLNTSLLRNVVEVASAHATLSDV